MPEYKAMLSFFMGGGLFFQLKTKKYFANLSKNFGCLYFTGVTQKTSTPFSNFKLL